MHVSRLSGRQRRATLWPFLRRRRALSELSVPTWRCLVTAALGTWTCLSTKEHRKRRCCCYRHAFKIAVAVFMALRRDTITANYFAHVTQCLPVVLACSTSTPLPPFPPPQHIPCWTKIIPLHRLSTYTQTTDLIHGTWGVRWRLQPASPCGDQSRPEHIA